MRAPRTIVISALGLVFAACSASNEPDATATDASTDTSRADASMHDTTTMPDTIMALDASNDTTCAIVEGHAGVVRLPLDVIVVVDSSPSFDRPRAAISDILAPSLIAELTRESIDYRVIVVGGSITAPPATMPERYFFVASGIGSGELLSRMPSYLRLALPSLRQESLKAVIDFTDATSDIGTAAQFYTGMTAADLTPYFGDSSTRRYFVHTVAGLANNTPSSTPWPPSAAIVNASCSGFSATPAQELQEVSVATGGYRFALCNFSEYGPFFNAVAQQAISRVQVPCEFEQPTTTTGQTPDISYAVMTLQSGGTSQTFHAVASMSACGQGFYLVPSADAGTGGRVVLCPDTCNAVRADSSAMVNFAFECPPG